MILNIGTTYRITFDEGFTDVNGIYKVLQIVNHDKLLELGIDLVSTLYLAVNKTQEDYNTDLPNYIDGFYYELKNLLDTSITYFVPEYIISVMPEVNISEYKKLILAVNIGTFVNEDDLPTVITAIEDLLETNHGIEATSNLLSYDTVWLSDDEYAAIEANREAIKIGATNYYSETVRLTSEVAILNAKIEALENIIISLQ